jgi:hypothetical protein
VNITSSLCEHAKAKLIINKADCAKSLLASYIPVLLDNRIFKIKSLNVHKVHAVLGQIGSALRFVPADH